MSKRPKVGHETAAAVDVWRREIGELSTGNFARRLGASEDLVLRLNVYKKFHRHDDDGCVNSLSFNTGGDILVSGSDDGRVTLWDWETCQAKLSFNPGGTLTEAKIMPYTNDRSIVTCARDGQVTLAQVSDGGQVEFSSLTKHRGNSLVAIEPGSPHTLYSCGGRGSVRLIDLRTKTTTKLFTSDIDLLAMAIDPINPNRIAVAGSDVYTQLYDIRKCERNGSSDSGRPADHFCPPHLVGNPLARITGLAFSDMSELLVSYVEDEIYLFTLDRGFGTDHVPGSQCDGRKTEEKLPLQVYEGHRRCVGYGDGGVHFFGPNCEYVLSGDDTGGIYIWKKKGGELIRVMAGDDDHIANCIVPHPHCTVLASSGRERDDDDDDDDDIFYVRIWTPDGVNSQGLS